MCNMFTMTGKKQTIFSKGIFYIFLEKDFHEETSMVESTQFRSYIKWLFTECLTFFILMFDSKNWCMTFGDSVLSIYTVYFICTHKAKNDFSMLMFLQFVIDENSFVCMHRITEVRRMQIMFVQGITASLQSTAKLNSPMHWPNQNNVLYFSQENLQPK